MKRHSSLLSIAVVLSAFAPTALTAAAIWGGENWFLTSGIRHIHNNSANAGQSRNIDLYSADCSVSRGNLSPGLFNALY
jgi:hypothetical protein